MVGLKMMNYLEDGTGKLRKRVCEKRCCRIPLLVAPMPTSFYFSILGNHECFEPYTQIFIQGGVLSGES